MSSSSISPITTPSRCAPPSQHSPIKVAHPPKDPVSNFLNIGRPLTAACATSFFYYPANTATHTMQLTNTPLAETVRNLYREGGLPRFWRGYPVAVGTVATAKTLSFGIHDSIISRLTPEDRTLPTRIGASTLAVTLKTLGTQPLENVKLRRQNGPPVSTIQAGKTLFHEHGALGFWRSAPLSFFKSNAAHTPYLVVHGFLKDNLPIEHPILRHAVAGTFGSLATLPTALPFDHLKTHVIMNQKYKSQNTFEAIHSMLSNSAKEIGWPRTIAKLYHSTSGAAIQVTLGGIFMAIGMETFNQLYQRFHAPTCSDTLPPDVSIPTTPTTIHLALHSKESPAPTTASEHPLPQPDKPR